MNNEQHAVDSIEEAEIVTETIPEGHIKTKDGQIIPREKAIFIMREIDERNGVKLIASNDGITLYGRGQNGNNVRINGKPKLTKAQKKAAKKARWSQQ